MRAQSSSTWRRRIPICLAILLGFSWAAYMMMPREVPTASHDRLPEDSSNGKHQQYGSTTRPNLKDIIQLLDLPPNYVPETGKYRRAGRLVVVGDVHGMKDALVDLLSKVKFDKKEDHLILAGDMISKGPDSPGVVDLAMKLGATGIRGNHENRVIMTYADMVAQHTPIDGLGPGEDMETTQDTPEEDDRVSYGNYKDRALVKALGEKRIKWLKECPVILRVGKLGNMGQVVVVHAGLVPGVELEEQDPLMVMSMRTIGNDGVPSDKRDGKQWIKVCFSVSSSLDIYFADLPCLP
jgi:hypothetical protein